MEVYTQKELTAFGTSELIELVMKVQRQVSALEKSLTSRQHIDSLYWQVAELLDQCGDETDEEQETIGTLKAVKKVLAAIEEGLWM